MRARMELLLGRLETVRNPPWDASTLNDARTGYQQGNGLYDGKRFNEAVRVYAKVLESLTYLDEVFQSTAEELRKQSYEQLGSEAYGAALTGYERLMEWFPQSTEIQDSLELTRQAVALQPEIDQIKRLVAVGRIKEAENRIVEVPAGVWTNVLVNLRKDISSFKRDQTFKDLITLGYQHMDSKQWLEASKMFTEALELRPDSTVAIDALRSIELEVQQALVSRYQLEYPKRLESEDWVAGAEVLQALIRLDPENEHADRELRRVNDIIAIEDSLDKYIVVASDVLDKQNREAIKSLLDQTEDHSYGERVNAKRARLFRLYVQYTTPITLTLLSDNKTMVRIQPGRDVGRFKSRRLEILPGTYLLIGTRRGYREARREVVIEPGSGPREMRIACNVRF